MTLVTDEQMTIIFRSANIPEPVREYAFAHSIGRKWRFDFCWPSEKCALEIDGGNWKPGGGRHGSDDDRDKQNHAAAFGWLVFHASHAQMLGDPWRIMDLIRMALTRGSNE